MTKIGTDLGTEGIAEDGGVGQTLSEIHQRSVSNIGLGSPFIKISATI